MINPKSDMAIKFKNQNLLKKTRIFKFKFLIKTPVIKFLMF